ncbi:hypothetical protein [uncultured Arthrobacter sp.]|uniref:hypothetical protein n=1 Tax=uncultured Arthrobacter sp. TaxID=114050 RepID=UPI0025FE5A4D|nr:hypothetical protein [uncultured Arthrobacter sp.]
MTAHTCKTLTDGCYRCDLNRDEISFFEKEIRDEAQAAWLAYRDEFTRRRYLTPRQTASQMRRREFIAGYLAANGMETSA